MKAPLFGWLPATVCCQARRLLWRSRQRSNETECPCRFGDHAPPAMESALRGASIVLVVVTKQFLRSKYCLQELHWACEEMQRQSQQAQHDEQSVRALKLIPIFYHDQDPAIGFGVDSLQRSGLHKLLRQHHAAATTADREQWLDALIALAKRTGIRQDSTGR